MEGPRFSAEYEGSVLVVVWHGTPTLEDFDALDAEAARGVEKNPDGIGLFIVIHSDAGKPPPVEVRKSNAELVKKFGPKLWGMVRVIEGGGLKQSMVRVALSTIDLFSNSEVPSKTTESVESGAAWIASLRQRELRASSVVARVDQLRRASL